jgi:site-specific DNA-methyltransferase (adenine-specific)
VYPERLVEICVLASTREGDFVFDPFTGSGTTGVVAYRLQRKFTGVELSPEYQAMAQRRIDAASAQLGLFLPEVQRSSLGSTAK